MTEVQKGFIDNLSMQVLQWSRPIFAHEAKTFAVPKKYHGQLIITVSPLSWCQRINTEIEVYGIRSNSSIFCVTNLETFRPNFNGYFIGSVNYVHGNFLFRLPVPIRQFVNHPVLSEPWVNGPGCGSLFYKSGLLFTMKNTVFCYVTPW